MRVFIPDITEFFAWLAAAKARYVVLRRFYAFDAVYPNIAPRHELDMLADDDVLPAIAQRYGKYKKGQGVECDIYNRSGANDGGERGLPYFPPALADAILSNRRLWKDRFYVPDAETHFLSLLYHICYRKAEASGIPYSDSFTVPPPPHHLARKQKPSNAASYIDELETLKQELGIALPNTLEAFHHYLKQANYSLPYAYLTPLVQDQFRRHIKSYFFARIAAEQVGELNLFVIRAIALKTKMEQKLLDELKKHYTVLAVKHIPWLTRLRTRNAMRGGKWKRGGWPNIAVIVYDPHPQPAMAADFKVHPYVFNNRQFFKPALREWFTRETGSNPKANPLHSTDNEAEALGHLNLFFTAEEQAEIVQKVTTLRRGQS